MRYPLFLLCLLLGAFIHAQRVVVPNQELLYPFLSDPSFLGEGQRVELTGALQLSNSEREQTTKFLNAQVALYDNVAFGLDYYNDSFDLYDYSTIMFSTAFKIGLGEYNHHIKIGLSAGGESRKQDSRPLNVIPDNQNFVEDVTGNNLDFTYRAALHYTNKSFTLGGYYNRLPVQAIGLTNQNEVLLYSIEEGYTAYALYNYRIADKMRVTPVFRYLDYLEDAIYEGALKFNYADKVEASVAYKNDYSINPAIRFRVIKALDIGYSFEKALGSMDFDDVHGLSASYKFFKADEEEPEWLRNAKETIEETDQKKTERKEEKAAQQQERKEQAARHKEEKEAAKKEKAAKKEEEKVIEPKEEMEPVKEEPVVVPKKEAEPVKEEVEAVEPAPVKAEPKEEVKEEVQLPIEKNEPKEKPKTIAETGMLETGYYIVVASFDTEKQARAYMQTLDTSIYFPRMGKKEKEGLLHVYIDSDNDGAEAAKRLKAHKLDKNFTKARLIKVD